ncbi:MAG: hypothetical protein LVR00_04125 [Rhabdochlamydiaceae bacterium]
MSFGRNSLDIVSGSTYFDGEEGVDLPPHLQNHPHVRSLGLHDLPYVRNPDDSYSYFTTEKGQKVAQVRIKMSSGRIIVQKRLPSQFTDPKIKVLQYLPLEDFNSIPAALAQRMGVEEFWKDSDNTVYGYTQKGVLLLSIHENRTINTPSGSFEFAEQVALEGSPSKEVFNCLRRALPADEILIKTDSTEFYVPALSLTIQFDPTDGNWNCTSPDVSGMILDLSAPPLPSTLVLRKREKRTNISSKLNG